MIVTKISSHSKDQIEEVALFIGDRKLGIDMIISNGITRVHVKDQKLISSDIHILTFKTKALLFPTISKLLSDEYGDDIPEIYSIPITHMDWKHSEYLTDNIVKI